MPDGSGRPLTDPLGIVIFNYPREGIWLEVDDEGLAWCWGYGAHMDDNTDVNGMGGFSAPLIAGGNSDSVVRVVVNGAPILSNGGFPMRFNSPDIDGSLRVDLADVALLAQHMGAQCP